MKNTVSGYEFSVIRFSLDSAKQLPQHKNAYRSNKNYSSGDDPPAPLFPLPLWLVLLHKSTLGMGRIWLDL